MIPVFISKCSSIAPDGTIVDDRMPAVEPDYKNIITDATLRRRMSRFVKMGVACGLDCIGETPTNEIDAIITATGLGCLGDTEKFLDSIIVNNERLLNPTPFIQSTFNTVGGQLALIKAIHSYNVTYVHRGLSFESALIDAMLQVADGARNVLVGAVDEITTSSFDVQKRLGLLQNYPLGEGAQFFMLNGGKKGTIAICAFATFNNSVDFSVEIDKFLHCNNLKISDLDYILSGSETITNKFENQPIVDFKKQCGDYQTATAFALYSAVQLMQTKNLCNVLIANTYQNINHSLILLRNIQ